MALWIMILNGSCLSHTFCIDLFTLPIANIWNDNWTRGSQILIEVIFQLCELLIYQNSTMNHDIFINIPINFIYFTHQITSTLSSRFMIKSIPSAKKKQRQVTSVTLIMSITSSIDGQFDKIYHHNEEVKKKKFKIYEDGQKQVVKMNSFQCTRQKRFQVKIKKDFTQKYRNNDKLLARYPMGVPYIMRQLAVEVKYCLQKAMEVTLAELNEVVLCKYSKKMDRFNIESKDALDKIKRRISQVLRVFQGASIVVISNKCIRITPFGMRNDLYARQSQSKRDQLKNLTSQLTELSHQKSRLLKVISFIKYLKNRNRETDENLGSESQLKQNSLKILLPVTISLRREGKDNGDQKQMSRADEVISNEQMILILSQSTYYHKQ